MSIQQAAFNYLNYLSTKNNIEINDLKEVLKIVSNIESSIKNYKNYRCLFNQVGTSAPTVVVLLNELGTVTWSRTAVGQYHATITEPLPIGKVFVNDNYVAYDPTLFGAQGLLKITYESAFPNGYIQYLQYFSNKISFHVYDSLNIDLGFGIEYSTLGNIQTLIDIKVYN